MDGPRRRVTQIPALFIVAAIPLIPDPPAPVERLPALDVESVRAAECEYRGITASFDELTRAYALTAFENPRLQGWQARPNPASPETEALVTARFLVDGASAPKDGLDAVPALRRRTGETLEVTWRLNSLAAVPVNAFDDYARDALDSFRRTVDGLLGRMVYLAGPAGLRRTPGAADSTRLEAATVLLLEEGSEDGRGGWTRVRVPADTTAGWVRSDLLRPVHGND